MDILQHNRLAWNKQSRQGSEWCTPVDQETISLAREGEWSVFLTPLKPVPRSWFGITTNQWILCLASGGGQQAPILAATGAHVTSFDLSEEQLEKDRLVAEREKLSLEIVQGNMADLSMFSDETFDLIFHPVSNVFVPDVEVVWRQCCRVLKPGGCILAGFMNPTYYLFDHEEAEKTKDLQVKYRLPFSDIEHLNSTKKQKIIDEQIAWEYSHSLDTQIGGQIKAGLSITGFYEDWWTDEATLLNRYAPCMIATKATKPSNF